MYYIVCIYIYKCILNVIYIYIYTHTYVYFIYIHTYVHLTLQRAKLTLQRAFFSKWRVEGSNRRGQGSGQAALCSQSSHANWSRVVMEFHIWNLISLVPMIAWIGFAVGTWQAYDAPVQVAGNCFISTAGKDWAAGCVVGCGVSSQSAVSWKKLIGMLLFSFLPSGQCQSCGRNTCKMESGSQSSC